MKTTFTDKVLVCGILLCIGSWIYKYNFVPTPLTQWMFLASVAIAAIYVFSNLNYLNENKLAYVPPLLLAGFGLAGLFY